MSNATFSIVCVTASAELGLVAREAVAGALPRASFTAVGPDAIAPGKIPAADAFLVDGRDPAAAMHVIRRLRAGGATGAVLLLVEDRDETLAARVAGFGALEQLRIAELPRAFGGALERAIGGEGWTPALTPVRDELRRTQRLAAAGEIALGLQHSMNNALTTVLAEAQLLGMEKLPAEAATSVQRIIDSTRKLVQLVRGLDVVSTKTGGS